MTAIIDGTNGVTTPNVLTSSSGVALTLQSAGTTAVTIDTSQNVGIGTASPTGKLHVSAPASTQYGTFDAVTASYAFTNYKVGGTAYGYIGDASGLVTSGTAGNLAIRFSGAMVFSGGADERMRINSGAPILCLAGGSTTATGTGIAFPATQSASSDANTLDDYEEGTWTPGVTFGGGTTGLTYASQNGSYVKIGRFVYASFNLQLSNKGSSSGSVQVTGLPFSISSTVSYGICIANTFNLNSTIQTVLQMNSGGTVMDIKGGGTDSNIGNSDFTNSTQIRATVAYTSA